MTNDEQLAGSVRYSSAVRSTIGEIRPGLFALWHADGTLLILTEDWQQVLKAYRARPALVQKIYEPKPNKYGIELEILI